MSTPWCCSCTESCGRTISRHEARLSAVNGDGEPGGYDEASKLMEPHRTGGSKQDEDEHFDEEAESEAEKDNDMDQVVIDKIEEDAIQDEAIGVNDEGAAVYQKCANDDTAFYYCGRAIPGCDARCGSSSGGPQCASCERYRQVRVSEKSGSSKRSSRQHMEEPGLYEVVHACLVREEVDTASAKVEGAELSKGDFVHVLEVMDVNDRIRARIASPAGWISLRRPTTGDLWAVKADNGPGLYQILKESSVREDIDIESAELEGSPLNKGDYTNVIEVIEYGDRVRAKIDFPCGWISVLSTSTGDRFAKKAEDEPGEYLLIDDVVVRENINLDSAVVGRDLKKNSYVNILEIKLHSDRIRARLEQPSGWMTLMKPKTGDRWATKVDLLEDGVAGEMNPNRKSKVSAGENEEVPLKTATMTTKQQPKRRKSLTEGTSTRWTLCLVIICLPIIPGAIFSFNSFGTLLPPVKNLPSNIVKGFDDVFKFANLEQDANSVKQSATAACNKCLASGETCANLPQPVSAQVQDTAVEKTAILAAFGRSLDIVKKVTGDKYFGTSDLESTFNDLTKITNDLGSITASMPCVASVPLYCAINASAGSIIAGMTAVDKAIDKFKNSDIVDIYEEQGKKLDYAHVYPAIVVLAMFFFLCFICNGGVCCCCHGNKVCGVACMAIIFFFLFWWISFVMYAIPVAAKIFLSVYEIKIETLKGEPTLIDVLDHIQTTFPGFWNVVLKDMIDGLDTLWLASAFLLFSTLAVGLFSLGVCCCRPYRHS